MLDQGPQGSAAAGREYALASGLEWVEQGCPICMGPTFKDPHGPGLLPCPTCQPPTTDPKDGGYVLLEDELEVQQIRRARLIGAFLITLGVGAIMFLKAPGEAAGLLGQLGT